VAQAFFEAGFSMGREAELAIHKNARGNIGGYWEHVRIKDVNRKILAENGRDWHGMKAGRKLSISADLRNEMRSLTIRLPDGFCSKDPRHVWTMDFWSEFFDNITLIGLFRNPIGFVRSLTYKWPERYQLDGEAETNPPLDIWQATNRRLLELSRSYRCLWLCFDDPVPMLKERLGLIIGELGRTFDGAVFDAHYIAEERRHSDKQDIQESLEQLPRPVAELYQELREAAAAPLPSRPTVVANRVKERREPLPPDVLYLDLVKRCLTRTLFPDGSIIPGLSPSPGEFDVSTRADGLDWPVEAETMIGLNRLDNLQYCVTNALANGVQGDLVEAGVWRGGAAIFMRAILEAKGDRTRRVWVADSFQGLPEPDPANFPLDGGDRHWELTPYLGIPMDVVESNFERYELLDDRVKFLPGWFKDTLPGAPIDRIAVLRIDADMYESTYEVLQCLYPKLQAGGYVIIDDYGVLPNCASAVSDYRRDHGINEEIWQADWSAVYWKKRTDTTDQEGPSVSTSESDPPVRGLTVVPAR
jgi:hypothetical protein